MFKENFSAELTKFYIYLGIIFSILVIVAPQWIFYWSSIPYEIFMLAAFIYSLVIMIKEINRNNINAVILFTITIILFLTSINDILYANRVLNTGFFQIWGMLIFLFGQAFVIARKYALNTFTIRKQAMKLSYELTIRKKLYKDLEISHKQFAESRTGTIMGLVRMAEFRDQDTGEHLERIKEYSILLADKLRTYPEYKDLVTNNYIEDLGMSSILHDIGKVGIPDSILLKQGPLTDDEFKIIQKHPTIGSKTITDIERQVNVNSFLDLGREIVRHHHERWDGSGYPDGLEGNGIPLSARIVALADVYDALTSKRPYKKAFTHSEAYKIITESSGTHFDPVIVEVFISLSDEFNSIRRKFFS
jgi:response regulator RpfG family c-di-GMP phosphodiesterase